MYKQLITHSITKLEADHWFSRTQPMHRDSKKVANDIPKGR